MPVPVFPLLGPPIRAGGLPGALLARAMPSVFGMALAVSDALLVTTIDLSPPRLFRRDPVFEAVGVCGTGGTWLGSGIPPSPLSVRCRPETG